MTDPTQYLRLPVPSEAEAALIPQHLAALFAAAETHMVGRASSLADRDVNFNGWPEGGIVTCASIPAVWMSRGKLGTSTNTSWHTIWERTEFVSVGGFAEGWSDNDSSPSRIRKMGSSVDLYVNAVRTGPDVVANNHLNANPGNIVDLPMLTGIPEIFKSGIPVVGSFRSTFTGGEWEISASSGALVLVSMHPGSRLLTGQTIRIRHTWSIL